MNKGPAFLAFTFLVLSPWACNEYRTIQYKVKVTQNNPNGATYYRAKLNGLGHWDGQQCGDCDMVFVKMDGDNKVWTCDFNLGLRKVVPKSGDPYFEMQLVHYGEPFPVPDDQDSLVFIVDGQDIPFTQNDDPGGVFYDVTPEELQAIIQGAAVVVRFIGLKGNVEKCFTQDNQVFFQEFLNDPTVTGTPLPTSTPGPGGSYMMHFNNKTIQDDDKNTDWGLGRRESPDDKKTRDDDH